MWVLEGPGSLQRWLRPGAQYTVGRSTKSDGTGINIIETSVSRKHLLIQVSDILPESAEHPSIHSQVTVTDLGSRFGSKLNGDNLEANVATKVAVTSQGASLQVGAKTELLIRWHPMVITFSTGERGDAHESMWKSAYECIAPTEIKIVPDFVDETTHFMTGSRHTSKLLYALVKNLPIVSTQYAQSLADASDSMEKDFQKLPDPSFYLPDSLWAANPARSSVFKNQTFIFLQKDQYEAMDLIIRSAGGEAIFSSDIKDAVSSIKGALVVRPSDPNIIASVEKLALVTVDQREFLTAISNVRPISPPKPVSKVRQRPQRTNMLDFMSQATSQPANQPASQPTNQADNESLTTSQSSRKRVKKIANTLFGETTEIHKVEPEITMATEDQTDQVTMMESQHRNESLEQSRLVPDSDEAPVSTDSLQGSTPAQNGTGRRRPQRMAQTLLESSPQQSTSLSKRSAPVDADQGGELQRSRASRPKVASTMAAMADERDSSEEFTGEEPQGQDDMITPEVYKDLSDIQNLAIVENTLTLRVPFAPRQTDTSAWAGRPNFKAFKRKATLPPPVKVTLADMPKVPTPEVNEFELEVPQRNASVRAWQTASGDSESEDEFGFKFS